MPSTPTASLASSERGRALTILAAILIMLVVDWLPEPAPLERAGDVIALTPNGKACLAILAFAITLWVTEAIPFAVTALFVLLLVPIFGIADYPTTVRAGFGNPLITFFIGVLFLSTGFTRSGLGTRLVLHMLRVVGTRTDRGAARLPGDRRHAVDVDSPTWRWPRCCCRSASGC